MLLRLALSLRIYYAFYNERGRRSCDVADKSGSPVLSLLLFVLMVILVDV